MRIVVAVCLVVVAGVASSRAATCTVTAARVLVKDGGFERPLPSMVGHAIPVAVTESSGAFHMDFAGLPAGEFQISGVENTISIEPVIAAGTLDAAGNVALPPVLVHFTTALSPGVDLAAMEPLNTGLAAVTLSGRDYATEGAALDFATGSLRLEGQGIVTNAPVVGSATSGISITCTLAPIPAADALPVAPSLRARGVAKAGKPVTGEVVGDALTLKGKVGNGANPLDPTQDVFVRVGVDGADVALLRAPAGVLVRKGKKLTAIDDGGSTLHVITGRKQEGNTLADVSGTLLLKESKKGYVVTLKHTGLDLAALSAAASATVTIGIGAVGASDQVTIKASTKKTTLK